MSVLSLNAIGHLSAAHLIMQKTTTSTHSMSVDGVFQENGSTLTESDRQRANANGLDIRLLVLDLDGTIVGDSNHINEPVKQAIKAAQAKGIRVAIATGRMYCSALRFHREIGSTLPLLAYQGALIQDPIAQKRYRHWPVAQSLAIELLDYFEQSEFSQEIAVHVYVDDRLYVKEIATATQAYAQRSQVDPIAIGNLRQALTSDPTKILAMSRDGSAAMADRSALADRLYEKLKRRYAPSDLYLTKSSGQFLEAANPASDKGTAVQYLAEEVLALQPHNVMAIGDNFNDLEMIEYAGIGVAMENAPEAVKSRANYVAPNVERNGAATAIQNILLATRPTLG